MPSKIENTKIDSLLQQTPIAIIGMSAIFPKAKNLREYWENIINQVDCITDVPASHWKLEDHYHPDPSAADKTYCKKGGFIPEIDFDPLEFGLPPNLLEITDVSQLLALVAAKQAIEDAGYGNGREFARDRMGVILGAAAMGAQMSVPYRARLEHPTWRKILKSSGISDEDTEKIIEKILSTYVGWQENSFPGMLSNIVSGRIANRLDLGGTNCVLDAACASSLAALKMAISELLERRCDMVLTGAVDLDNTAFAYLCFSKTPALSRTQQIRPFDTDADGMLLGEGIGMVVLKRLQDAKRDGDRIYAVIKGMGTSSDGKYKSIYAPSLEGQMRALERAYEDAGIDAKTVGAIEAHGTGTLVGDPVEFAALDRFFSKDNPAKQSIALGSVKSQIGHTKGAAGAASLIKAALALHHKVLPPTINITKPNPRLDIENSPFYLNTETRPWISSDQNQPRRAAISSFGFGGTNYHLVLEEYESEQSSNYRLHRGTRSVFLFAPTPDRLLARSREVLTRLQQEEGQKYYARLVEECESIDIPLAHARVGFTCNSITEAAQKLSAIVKLLATNSEPQWEHPQGIYYRQCGIDLEGKVVALFPGQGSQYLEMGKELAINFPYLRQIYAYADSLLTKDGLDPVSKVIFPVPAFEEAAKEAQTKKLQGTEYAQPAIGAFSFGLYKILQQAGFKADFAAGHSFGELTALWSAGVLGDEEYFFLIKTRGQAMAKESSNAGAMLAVQSVQLEAIEPILNRFPSIAIANYNSDKQIVLAGEKTEIVRLQQVLQEQNYSATLLPVSAAFHSQLVSHAKQPLDRAIDAVRFHSPKIPVYSNVTGDIYPRDLAAIRATFKKQLLSSVLFKQQIEKIHADGGYCFVEIGPRSILTQLVKEILGDRPHLAIALNGSRQKDSDRQFREALVQLKIAGLPLQNPDTHQRTFSISEPVKKGPSVSLNGVNYISEKTKQAFEKVWQDDFQISKSSPPEPVVVVPEILQNSFNKPDIVNADMEKIVKNAINPAPANDGIAKSDRPLDPTERTLADFNQNQQTILHIHRDYLEHQKEYVKFFVELMRQQNELLQSDSYAQADPQTKSAILDSLERNITRFHEHQSQTLRVHEQSLQHQVEYLKNFCQLANKHYDLLLSRVEPGERTPIERVKVEDSFLANLPTVPELIASNGSKPKKTTEDRELEAIHTPLPPSNGSNGHHSGASLEVPLPPVPIRESVTSNAPHPKESLELPLSPALIQKDSSIDYGSLSATLLKVVSEKTGYPAEMLEMDMDMEADLGIDSLKRIEIFGALQEMFPDITPPKPEELGELRTLAQVAKAMHSLIPQTTRPSEEIVAPKIADAVPSKDDSIDYGSLSATLLKVVSEKTGYPAEMLEMDMDMEADLGIDSLKRIEIFGALQEMFPDITPPKPEELGELRTLAQVAKAMHSLIPQTTRPEPMLATNTPVRSPAENATNLEEIFLNLVSQKTGYPREMLQLDMDIESDLGIDKIKGFEILKAMLEHIPDPPQIDLFKLARVRTLRQIIEYINRQPIEKKSPLKMLALRG